MINIFVKKLLEMLKKEFLKELKEIKEILKILNKRIKIIEKEINPSSKKKFIKLSKEQIKNIENVAKAKVKLKEKKRNNNTNTKKWTKNLNIDIYNNGITIISGNSYKYKEQFNSIYNVIYSGK